MMEGVKARIVHRRLKARLSASELLATVPKDPAPIAPVPIIPIIPTLRKWHVSMRCRIMIARRVSARVRIF